MKAEFVWVENSCLSIVEYDSAKPSLFASDAVRKFPFVDCKNVPFVPMYCNNFNLNVDAFQNFMIENFKRVLSVYFYFLAIPDDAPDMEQRLLHEFLGSYKCKKIIICSQAGLLSNLKQFIAVTMSPRCLCISIVKNRLITIQEFIPVNVIGQDKIQVALRLKRTIEMLQLDDNFPVFCYGVGETYKVGTEVKFGEIMRNAIPLMEF